MQIGRLILPLLGFVFFGQYSSLMWASVPQLNNLKPPGGQIGTAVRLTLIGQGLTNDISLTSSIPGTLTPLAAPKERALIGKQLSFLLEINPDAKVGAYTLRTQSNEGISNILLFTVGAFPETTDLENEVRGRLTGKVRNDTLEMAQDVEIPTTINGALTIADQDFYRFHVSKKETLVVETEARRIGSAIDPILEIFDEAGNSIARNQDAPGIGVDSRIQFTAPADGRYVVSVRDSKFSEQQRNHYRLKIADYAFAEGIYPLGGQRGTTLPVELFGGNLNGTVRAETQMTTRDPVAEFVDVCIPGPPGALPLRIAISDNPEIHEHTEDKVTDLPKGTWANGRISASGERDRYRIAVKPGQIWHIELQAAKLGISKLYGVLNLRDAQGNVLGTTRQIGLRYKRFGVLDVGENPNSDQYMIFTVPKETHEIYVEIEDLLGRGGPAFGYRMLAAQRSGNFIVNIEPEELNVPLRGSALVKLKINRLGYEGPITFSIPNLPDDWTMNGGNIPAVDENDDASLRAISNGFLTITPKPGAEPKSINLEIWGEGRSKGKLIRRRARGPGIKSNMQFRSGPVIATENIAPWLGADLPAMVTRERAAAIEMITPHYIRAIQGTTTTLPFEFLIRQSGATSMSEIGRDNLDLMRSSGTRVVAKLIPDEKNPNKGVYILGGQLGWGPGQFDVVLKADINVAGSQETVYSQAITIDMVRAYEITPLKAVTLLRPGSDADLAIQINRQLNFDREVEIKAENLPLGISCKNATNSGLESHLYLPCKVRSTVEMGEYEIDLNTSSTLLEGDGKVIPFSPPPFTMKVKVASLDQPTKSVADGL